MVILPTSHPFRMCLSVLPGLFGLTQIPEKDISLFLMSVSFSGGEVTELLAHTQPITDERASGGRYTPTILFNEHTLNL